MAFSCDRDTTCDSSIQKVNVMRLVEGLLDSTKFWALQNTVKTMGKRNFVQRWKKWCGWFDHHDSPFTPKL